MAAVCVVGAAGAAYTLLPTTNPGMASASVDARPPDAPPFGAQPSGLQSAAVASASPAPPRFDIVRVGPQGNAVFAGRADPGATVTVTDGDNPLGEVRADARGEWVLVPTAPLTPGARELSLSARTGTKPLAPGGDTVLLVIPPPVAVQGPAPGPVMALLVPRSGAPRLLQGTPDAVAQPAPAQTAPARTAPTQTAPTQTAPVQTVPGSSRLALGTVDYDDQGAIRFAGAAPPGAPVRVYVDNALAGDALTDALGQWTLTPQGAVAAGVHRLRIDQITAAGRVESRVELPFQRTAIAAGGPVSDRVVVQPGQNLWRLARQAYGTGMRYTVIYLANRDQIRDPKLIYPGQAFTMPAPSSQAASRQAVSP